MFLYLLLPSILLGIGLYGAHAIQVKRTARSFLAQANRAVEQGDSRKAVLNLKRFLVHEPQHAEALGQLGLIQSQLAQSDDDWSSVSGVLEQALRYDPQNRRVRRRLVDVQMRLFRFDDAQAHLNVLIGESITAAEKSLRIPKAEQAELQDLLGQCAFRRQDYSEAARHYKDAIALAPQRVETYVRLADLLRNALKDPTAADRVMDARKVNDGLIAAAGHSFRAYLERGLYRKKYQIDQAEQDVARALELAPTETEVVLTAAEFALDRRDFGVARSLLAAASRQPAPNWRIAGALAELERKAGRHNEAEVCLRGAIDSLNEQNGRIQLRWALVDLLIDDKKWTEARSELESLGKEQVRTDLLKYLNARIQFGESKWIEAANELEAIYPLMKERTPLAYQANLMLGQCYEQLGDLDARYAAFRRAVALDPSGVPARLGLAATLAAMGRLDEAISGYRHIFDEDPRVGPDTARLMILRNLQRSAGERDWREVEEVLDKSSRTMPGSAEIAILRAEAFAAQGQSDRARELLERARDERPTEVELWIALSELADHARSAPSALSVLKQAEERLGDRAELRLARIKHWAVRGGSEAPKALTLLEHNLDQFSPLDKERILRALADAHVALGNDPATSRILRQLVNWRPRDLGLRFAQFNFALRTGDGTAMEESLEGVRLAETQLLPQGTITGPVWQYARSRYLIWSAKRPGHGPISIEKLDEARLNLAEASKSRPYWPVLALAEAEIDELSGRPDAALKAYRRAIDLGMHDLNVIRQTVQLLYDRQRYDQADKLIRRLQADGLPTTDPRFQRLAAEVSLRANDPVRALELARETIPNDSKNYRDRLWLGQILWAAGEPGQAEPHLRRAVELNGQAPETWITLVQFLARTERKDDARKAIRQAQVQLASEQAPLAVAQCLAELGQFAAARAQLRPFLAAHPDDVRILRADASFAVASGAARDAEAELRAIAGKKNEASDDAEWARRQLAIVLATSGNRQKSLESLQLVGLTQDGAAYVSSDDEPIDEVRAKAKVLSLRNNRTARQSAIRAIQHVIDREPFNIDDQFLLVELYEAEGNWSKARGRLQFLLAGHEQNALYLAHNTLILLRQGSIDDAQSSLAKLERLEPASLRTLELKSRLLTARGRSGESVPQLMAWAENHADEIGYIAKLLEEFGQYGPALKLFERAASGRPDRPERALALAAFLGRRNRVADALDLCEKIWASCRPEDAAATIAAVLYSAPIDDAHCRRAAQLIEAEMQKSAKEPGLLFHLGNIRSLQGRYQDAEALYRQAFALDQTNSGPLTNLAWLLVRREGKGTEALQLVSEAILKDGPTPDLLDTRALAYMATGQRDLAIKDLEDAIAVRPSPLKYVHLAQAYLLAKRRNDASSALLDARAAGLSEEGLSPLERENCQRLVQELAQR